MAYFKIGKTDFSNIVNELKVDNTSNYNSQTNAAGNTVVDYINTKRIIEVGIIPLDDTNMAKEVDQFLVEEYNVYNYKDRKPAFWWSRLRHFFYIK